MGKYWKAMLKLYICMRRKGCSSDTCWKFHQLMITLMQLPSAPVYVRHHFIGFRNFGASALALSSFIPCLHVHETQLHHVSDVPQTWKHLSTDDGTSKKLKISIILSCTWIPLDIPLLNNGLFQLLLSAVSPFYSFITIDAVLVLLVILCIVLGFLGTVTAIIKTASLLFATCCVPIQIGQHHCLEFACDCIHKCLCLFIYAGVPYEFLSQ